ncbi:MAG TPA: iron-sulfur cluster repair di-iron protein [Oscillatoriaceae cyanobacterium]
MTTNLTADLTVGQMVAERPSRAKVFERHAIDYCCGGKLSLAAICGKKGLDARAILTELAAHDAAHGRTDEQDWSERSLAELARYIVTIHHAFLREAMPRLAALSQKVARVHGPEHPELLEVARVFAKFQLEMDVHMQKEEGVLFPAIAGLEQGNAGHMPIQFPIRAMESEHDDAGRDLEQLRELTSDYALPPDACNSYRALFDGLQEVEVDTHLHIHLENNVLFPRAIALSESSRLGSAKR